MTDAGFAQVFLNIVLDEAVEEKSNGDKVQIGMVVSMAGGVVSRILTYCSIGHSGKFRGYARGRRRIYDHRLTLLTLQALERIGGDDRQQHR